MPTARELLIDFADLKLVGIACQTCRTEIVWDVTNKQTKFPTRCSGCGIDFDTLFVGALEGYRDAFRNLTISKNQVHIRLRKNLPDF
jgi:hypothetical protein